MHVYKTTKRFCKATTRMVAQMLLLLIILCFNSSLSATETTDCEAYGNTASIRHDLTVLNNLLDDMGWHNSVYLHISYRYNTTKILIPELNPSFKELTVNELSFLYKEIYSSRTNVNNILHIQNPIINAISYDSDGILPIDQQFYTLHPISYNINDLIINENSFVLLLPGNGAICIGHTIAATYRRIWYLLSAAHSQIQTLSILDRNDIIFPPKNVQKATADSLYDPPPYIGYNLGDPEFESHKRKYGYSDVNIADNTDVSTGKYSDIREDLAKLYHLIGKLGLDQIIYNHITARLPVTHDNYTQRLLINAFGLDFSEVTANNLVELIVKVEIGNNEEKASKYKIINGGNSVVPFKGRILNNGLELHAAVHSFREDANFVIHIHNAFLSAISVYENGLLPINKLYYDMIRPVRYHPYGNFAKKDNKTELMNHIGNESNVVILRNHGIITMGKTVEDAFNRLYVTLQLAKMQINVMKMGLLTDDLLKELIEYVNNDSSGDMSDEMNTKLNFWSKFKKSL
eukprot:96631_1